MIFPFKKTKSNLEKGYSLVEMIIYVSILSIISVVLVNTTLSFTTSYRDLRALRNIDHSAIDVMERMTRDIRSATSIDTLNSTLGSNPGVLVLVKTNGAVSTTTRFYLDNGTAKVDLNGVYFGPLTLEGTEVTSMVFRKMDSPVSSAVKIEMTITSAVGGVSKSKKFYSTIVVK